MTDRIYPAKLILFGEYSLMLGSQVLGVPLMDRYGRWADESGPNSLFKEGFFDYIREHCSSFLDLDRLVQLEQGDRYYRSNIKRGYGTGSSGALSSAIYDWCGGELLEDLAVLQSRLAIIESFFHGKSSGFDPLISYLQKGIKRDQAGEYGVFDMSELGRGADRLYLVDSGGKRLVKGLVPRFVEMAEGSPEIYQELVQINDIIIDRLIKHQDIKAEMARLSRFHWEHMRAMILPELYDIWEAGLETDDYYMKICGAGGGGYYMLYAVTDSVDIKHYQLDPIVRS